MQLVSDAILHEDIDALDYIQKERSDDTNDTQLPMHVLVSCHHIMCTSWREIIGPIPRICVARTNEILRLLASM